MRARHSLRSRVILGSMLWTAGLLPVAHMIALAVIRHDSGMHVVRSVQGVAMLVVAVGFMAGGLWQLRRCLAPFDQLRTRLSALRDGSERRLEGQYPSEVQPLVNDLNALLDRREQIVNRARSTAGDLAHGLKTPLAVLSQEAERAAAGDPDLARTLGQQVERMRRQIEYHLARARAAASGAETGARCAIAPSIDGLRRTLLRLHSGRGISIDVDTPAHHTIRGRREDLDEMLGNILDNACKWAKSRVRVESSETEGAIVVHVDDDGRGLPASMREGVLKRGVRADEAMPGSGLGLAIVSDLAELYGGSISLGDSPLGGLRARLELPR